MPGLKWINVNERGRRYVMFIFEIELYETGICMPLVCCIAKLVMNNIISKLVMNNIISKVVMNNIISKVVMNNIISIIVASTLSTAYVCDLSKYQTKGMSSWMLPTYKIYISLLIHWGWVTHVFVGNLTTIGSDNGLLPYRRQAIIWTNVEILLIGPKGKEHNSVKLESKF